MAPETFSNGHDERERERKDAQVRAASAPLLYHFVDRQEKAEQGHWQDPIALLAPRNHERPGRGRIQEHDVGQARLGLQDDAKSVHDAVQVAWLLHHGGMMVLRLYGVYSEVQPYMNMMNEMMNLA